jgi:hypothetical protein
MLNKTGLMGVYDITLKWTPKIRQVQQEIQALLLFRPISTQPFRKS